MTIARSVSATFAGIRPRDAPAFILAQLAGAALAVFFFGWLLRSKGLATRREDVAQAAD